MRSIRIQRADRFKLNFKEYLMRALKNDPLDHFLICMEAKKDPTGSFYIIYNIYVIIKKQNKEHHKFISYFIIQSIIWKKKSLVISWKIRYSYFTG